MDFKEAVEKIKDSTDIVRTINDYVPLKKRGLNYLGLCPFHQEKTPSFNVNSAKNIWHCFGCGEGGNVYSFLMKINNWTFGESVKYLAEKTGINLPQIQQKSLEEKNKYQALYKSNEHLLQAYENNLHSLENGKVARDYLKKRAITEETTEIFKLGFATDGRFQGRLVFPIIDLWQRCLGFGGRIFSEEQTVAKNKS